MDSMDFHSSQIVSISYSNILNPPEPPHYCLEVWFLNGKSVSIEYLDRKGWERDIERLRGLIRDWYDRDRRNVVGYLVVQNRIRDLWSIYAREHDVMHMRFLGAEVSGGSINVSVEERDEDASEGSYCSRICEVVLPIENLYSDGGKSDEERKI